MIAPASGAIRLGTRWKGNLRSSIDPRAVATVTPSERPLVVDEIGADELTHAVLTDPPRPDLLDALSPAETAAMFERAADLLAARDLETGTAALSPAAHDDMVARLTGLPIAVAARGRAKLADLLRRLPEVVERLAPAGVGPAAVTGPRSPRHVRVAGLVGVVAPGNTPGAHAGWLPLLACRAAVVVRASGRDPLTPHRLAAALTAAGLPAEALAVVAGGHDLSRVLVSRTPRSVVFGRDESLSWVPVHGTIRHGTGRSKVFIGPDLAGRPDGELVDIVVESIIANAGRACVDASAVWIDGDVGPWVGLITERLQDLEPRSLLDPDAVVPAFASEADARQAAAAVDRLLTVPGAHEVSAGPGRPRVVARDGTWFVRPTVVRCARPDHPAADTELPFPFVAVVRGTAAGVARVGGLSVAALTDRAGVLTELAGSPSIRRLVTGRLPTNTPDLEQVAEGDPWSLLYERRGFAGPGIPSRDERETREKG